MHPDALPSPRFPAHADARDIRGSPDRPAAVFDASLAERMVREALAKARWREIDLATQPKGHRLKVRIAQTNTDESPMDC